MMVLIPSLTKALVVLVALAACAFAFTPRQEKSNQKLEVRKRIVDKSAAELEAAAVTRVEPDYPAVARWAGVGGEVGVRVLINEEGEVVDASADYEDALLQNAAVAAARAWKFRPTVVEGAAVKVRGELELKFPEAAGRPALAGVADDDEVGKAKAAVAIFPDAAEAYYWLGDAYASDEQYKEAEKAFKKAIELKPDYEEVYLGLIKLYAESRAGDDIMRTYRQAVEKVPRCSLKLLNEYARKLAETKRPAETLEISRRAVEINPEDLNVRHLLAWALLELRRYDDALAELLQQLKIDPENPTTTQYLAGVYFFLKRYDEAVAAYQRVIVISPDYPQLNMVYANLGFSLMYLNRPSEALEALNHSIELNGNFPGLYCSLGTAYFMLSRFDEAIPVLKKGVEAQPTDPCTHASLAYAYAVKGRFAEAEQGFRTAAGLPPEKAEAYINLAGVLRAQNKQAEAESVMRQAIKRMPDSALLHIYYGAMLSQLHRQAEAEAEMREALRLDPDNAAALNNLGYSMVERGEKLNEALEMIQRAVNAEPDNGAYLDSLGWAYFKLGRLEEAERYLTRATQGPYKSSAIFEHLGDTYEKQSKRGLANGAWQQALLLAQDEGVKSRLKAKLGGEPQKPKSEKMPR